MSAEDDPVLRERRGRILLITINRPDQRNAVNAAVSHGIAAALDELDAEAGLSVGVLTGAGKGFCAGMDLKAFVAGERPHVEGRGFAGITQRSADKPLIAAIEGFAVAGGLEVALACDLIVAARGARLGIPEVKRSLVAAGGALLRLPRALPRNVAMELALTGDPIEAERAHELGLVNRLANPGQALQAALELAETIAANGPLALAATKRIMVEAADWPDAEFFERQREITDPVFDSEDAREGATAFAERRDPIWKGRYDGARGVSRADGGGDRRQSSPPKRPRRWRIDRPRPTAVAVLAQVDPLPGPEREPAPRHRQRQRRPEQRGLDVRRHVVGALQRVGPVRSVLRNRGVEVGLEVAAHVRRGVLVQGQRGRGVLDQQVQQPDRDVAQLGQGVDDVPRDEVKPPRAGTEVDLALDPHRASELVSRLTAHHASGSRATRRSTREPLNGTPSASSRARWRSPLARVPSARTTRCHGTRGSSHACSTAPATRGAPGETSP